MTQAVHNYPSLSDRIQALFIDTIAIIVSMFIISSFVNDNTPDWVRIVLFVAIWAVYEPLCNSLLGFTIGGYIKGLRVRKHSNEEQKINILQSYVRSLIKYCLGWLSFVTIHSNTEKRAIHDLAAGSVMLKK